MSIPSGDLKSSVRSAAYVEMKARLDARKTSGKLKCKPPNRRCGNRCIPPSWNCRIKGEGGDSHQKVVAGDPLAGAASIARGLDRLKKGAVSGNIKDIQGGRAAIERGIVKAVPGQGIKQKQALRAGLNRTLVPVASVIFAGWAIRQGHRGAKLLIPGYEKGLGKTIEDSVSNALEFGLDRVPVYGPLRVLKKKQGNLQAQRLGIATARSVTRDPSLNPEIGFEATVRAGQGKRSTYPGLHSEIASTIGSAHVDKAPYQQFRSDLLKNVVGYKEKGESAYSETATSYLLAKQFSIDPSVTTNHRGGESKQHLLVQVSSRLTEARNYMRQDMETRGLTWRASKEGKQAADIEKYTDIAVEAAATRWSRLNNSSRAAAEQELRSLVRDLVTGGSVGGTKEKSTSSIASELFNTTKEKMNVFFGDLSKIVDEDTNPRNRTIQAGGNADGYVRSALIGVANRVKNEVGLNSYYRIQGANHAELVLQKLYYEKVVPGSYRSNRRSTWSTTDAAIRHAATDMGWRGTQLDEAVTFLRQNGFARLERSTTNRPTRTFGRSLPPSSSGEAPRRARRKTSEKSIAERIATLVKYGYSEELARKRIMESEAKKQRRQNRNKSNQKTDAYDLHVSSPIRYASFALVRRDLREGGTKGKACGASYIPKSHKCNKGTASGAPTTTEKTKSTESEPEKPEKKGNTTAKIGKTALGVAIGAVGAISVTVGLDAYRHFNPKDLPETPSYKSVVRAEKKRSSEPLTSGAALANHYDREVSEGRLTTGDVVYTKQSAAQNSRHFAVYMGKVGENHQFIEIVRDATDNTKASVVMTEFGPTADKSHYASVYAKAPKMKQDKKLPVSEIKNRAYSLMASELQYNELDNNCEQFARMIAAGNPRSRQVDKLSFITKGIYKGLESYLDEGKSPANLPTVKEQAQILDIKKRISDGDRGALKELKAFTTLISNRKRTDSIVEDTLMTGLPSPSELLADSKSELEDVTRIKMYLMLILSQGRAIIRRKPLGM